MYCMYQLKKALEDLTDLLAEKEALAQRCEELDIQVNTELTVMTSFTDLLNVISFCVLVNIQSFVSACETHTNSRGSL